MMATLNFKSLQCLQSWSTTLWSRSMTFTAVPSVGLTVKSKPLINIHHCALTYKKFSYISVWNHYHHTTRSRSRARARSTTHFKDITATNSNKHLSRSRISSSCNALPMHDNRRLFSSKVGKKISPVLNETNNYSPIQNESGFGATDVHDGKSLVNRFVYVKTLKDFYDDIPTGVVMDTAYADSRPNSNFDPSIPVIVGLHDTPGDHNDLTPLLQFFAKIGCRTVCPTFPGHGQTRGVMRGHDDIFCQTTLERANFVNDFLSNLDIERVDILVGVGASCYTAMALCTLRPEVFHSTALISPWPVSKLRFPTNPSFLKRLQEFWDMQLFRLPVRLLLSALKIGNANSVQEKITLSYLLANINFGEVGSHALALSMKKVPYVIAYGGQDKVVDHSLYEEILHNLEISPNAVTKFDGALRNIRIPGALVFPNSDYQILTEQRGVLCAYLLRLLQSLHPYVHV